VDEKNKGKHFIAEVKRCVYFRALCLAHTLGKIFLSGQLKNPRYVSESHNFGDPHDVIFNLLIF
jgi:hypothetical protein